MTFIGAPAKIRRIGRKIHFTASVTQPGNSAAIAHLKSIRNLRLASESKFIHKMEAAGIGNLFADGREIRVQRIHPVLHICRQRNDSELFHYCRLLQSFPTANLIGRQLRAIVFDEGQDRPFIIGVIGLSSSPYFLASRDQFLNWNSRSTSHLRKKGLDALMQLAVCMSIPPYSYLLGGKLTAALALSDTIAKHYQRRYKSKLLGLLTICAGGNHCPIFHRIMLRPGGLYRRVGQTAGYTTAFFSEATMNGARRLVDSLNRPKDSKIFGKSMRIIKSALRICGLPYVQIVRNGLKKGVYLGFSSSTAIDNLRNFQISRAVPTLPESQIVNHWKERILSTRIAREDVHEQIRGFAAKNLLLSSQLPEER